VPKSVIEFEKVSKVYPRRWMSGPAVTALDQVSFSILPGEVFGVIGPNRSGKTTIVKSLLTICRPTRGRIARLGAPWSDRSTLARVGYVHESQSFPKYLTATGLLGYYGGLSQLPRDAVQQRSSQLLEQFSLADRAHEPIGRYSKGMLQRLALAQALLSDPELLVLDEPSEGMDLTARRLLHQIIRERREQGKTVLLVSHALADVRQLCDRVAVLRSGQISFLGSPDDLASPDEHDNAFEQALEPLYLESLHAGAGA
jgi:ABC-2 type transport system ATP-binding protein